MIAGIWDEMKDKIDFDLLAEISMNFSGAEIQSTANNVWLDSFDTGKLPTTESFIKVMSETVPFSCTVKEDIEEMRSWQEGRAVRSSSGDIERILNHNEIVSHMKKIIDGDFSDGKRKLQV